MYFLYISGSFGGGQEVTLTGSGFTEDAVVLLCDVECDVDQSGITTTTLTFVTPSMEDCELFIIVLC